MREKGDDRLDGLDLLEQIPAILRGLTRELNREDAVWKPAPDRVSVGEVLAHLSHSDSHRYRPRVDRFLNQELPELEPDDAQMYLDLYRDDLGHIRQIAELVRARKHWQQAGPLGREYDLKP